AKALKVSLSLDTFLYPSQNKTGNTGHPRGGAPTNGIERVEPFQKKSFSCSPQVSESHVLTTTYTLPQSVATAVTALSGDKSQSLASEGPTTPIQYFVAYDDREE